MSISGLGGVKEWKKKIALLDIFPLQQDVSAPHFLSATVCFPSPCGQSTLQCRHRDTLACEENRSMMLQTPSIGIADKVKADLHEIPNFSLHSYFTRLHSTSLLACPTSLLDVYPTVIQTIEKNKKTDKKTIGLKTSDVNIKVFRLTLWIPQYLYSQITT